MADYGLFIGFGETARGRERAAIGVFAEAFGYFARLEQAGEIETWTAAFLEPHGGDLGGFILLHGAADELARIRLSDEFQKVSARAGLVVENLGVVTALMNGALGQRTSTYQAQLDDLA